MALAGSNMVIAFFMAILTIIILALNYPPAISTSLRWARAVKDVITGSGLSPTYNIWLEFFIEERQLVFIGFTIIMRMVLAVFTYAGHRLRQGLRARF
jgi:Cu/Ag efflux pump CusA